MRSWRKRRNLLEQPNKLPRMDSPRFRQRKVRPLADKAAVSAPVETAPVEVRAGTVRLPALSKNARLVPEWSTMSRMFAVVVLRWLPTKKGTMVSEFGFGKMAVLPVLKVIHPKLPYSVTDSIAPTDRTDSQIIRRQS